MGYGCPYQQQTQDNLNFLQLYLRAITLPSYTLLHRFFPFTSTGQVKLCWETNPDKSPLYFLYKYDVHALYDVSLSFNEGQNTSSGCWYVFHVKHTGRPVYDYSVSIWDAPPLVVTPYSISAFSRIVSAPASLWGVLLSVFNQLIWKYFCLYGGSIWIHRGLIIHSLIIVNDRSYMPDVAKNVCSAPIVSTAHIPIRLQKAW